MRHGPNGGRQKDDRGLGMIFARVFYRKSGYIPQPRPNRYPHFVKVRNSIFPLCFGDRISAKLKRNAGQPHIFKLCCQPLQMPICHFHRKRLGAKFYLFTMNLVASDLVRKDGRLAVRAGHHHQQHRNCKKAARTKESRKCEAAPFRRIIDRI